MPPNYAVMRGAKLHSLRFGTNPVPSCYVQIGRYRGYASMKRNHSTATLENDSSEKINVPTMSPDATRVSPGLARLPTSAILRSLLLGTFFTSPLLLKSGFAVMGKIAHSPSVFLNPDKNPILRALIKPFIYDQFCAGTNRSEINQTRGAIKRVGYSGVILCYGKEVQVSASNELQSTGGAAASENLEIDQWRDGNLQTLDMVGEGDWIGIK